MTTRFAIASQGRSGSTMLQHLLDSHPDARCQGEMISGWGDWQENFPSLSMAEYLQIHVFPGERRAEGFKMMHEYLRTFPMAWEILCGLGAKLVINRRRNKVDQYLSLRLAQQWTDWRSVAPYPRTKLQIDPENLLMHAQVWSNIDAELVALEARFPTIFVTYEDLLEGEGLDEVQRFLDLDPMPLSTPTVRARRQTRRDVIENWDDVVRALSDTPWKDDLTAEE